METQEKEKKKKYLLPCLVQRKHLIPLIVYVDRILGLKERILLK